MTHSTLRLAQCGSPSPRVILFFVLAVCVFSAVFAFADSGAFVYDDHGRRDPFLPQVSAAGTVITYEADLTAGDMVLEGIVADAQGNNVAVVNGKIVKTGDMIGAYAVAAVRPDNVELVKDGQRSIVKLKKGGR